jgi:hypothetical protein
MNEQNAEKAAEGQEKCPAPEIVSAYCDGELSRDSAEAKHIESCPVCGNLLKSYKAIGNGLKSGVSAKVPVDIVSSIKAGVHKKLQAEKTSKKAPIPFPVVAFRAAAAFIICGILTVYTLETVKTIDEGNPALAGNSEHDTNFFTADAHSGGEIPLESFSPVSFREAGKAQNVVIPDKVHQVWTVKNPDAALNKFLGFAQKLGVSIEKSAETKKKNAASVDISLSKKQLVELVRKCHSNGFKLVSPDAPQPEQNHFAGKPDSKVNYKADFILNGK